MNEQPRQTLCDIVEQYGDSIFNDARRCESILRDLCAAHPREVNLLVGAVKLRVPHDLLGSSRALPLRALLAQLKQRLIDNLAVTDEAGEWALYSWALALRLVTRAELANLPRGRPSAPAAAPRPAPPPGARPLLGASRRLEEWKQRLIDLTRRNRLLHFNPAKGSTLTVTAPDLATVFGHVYDREKPWRFWTPPEEPDGKATAAGRGAPPPAPPPRRDELVCGGLGLRQLEKALRAVYRRARTDYQERGIRVLFLAFGTLEWQEREEAGPVISPLVLCPVELQRVASADEYLLRWAEEDPVLNPALSAKLKSDFGFALPAPPDDLDAPALSAYIKALEGRARARGWAVSPTVHLGMFSFHKLSMYQDMVANASRIMSHPVVLGLAGEPMPAASAGHVPGGRELDDVPPEETFQILDADSSQQQATQAALRGHSLVLQGPPGTGKSQTIANIIAEFIARGRTVLFVSEKMAALEVVYKRLRDVKLDEFCLELHSHKANKREVVAALKRALDGRLSATQPPAPADYERLRRARGRLNDYVAALHEERSPLGATVREAYEILSGLHAVPLVACELPGVARLDPARLDEWGRLSRRLAGVWQVAREGAAHPWFGCRERRYDMQTRDEWAALLQGGLEALDRLQIRAEDLAADIGVEPPAGLDACAWLRRVGTYLESSPGPDPGWLTAGELDDISREAERYRGLSAEYWALREDLASRYGEGFFGLPAALGDGIRRLCSSVAAESGFMLVDREPGGRLLFERGPAVAGFLTGTQAFARDLLNDLELPGRLFGLDVSGASLTRAEEVARLAVLSAAENKPDASWLDPARLSRAAEAAARLRPRYDAYRELREGFERRRARLLERYDEGLFDLDLDGLVERFGGFIYRTPLRFIHPGFRRDRRSVLRVSRAARLPAGIEEDLLEAREVVRLCDRVSREEPPAEELFGGYDRRADTDFERMGQALRAASEVLDLTGGPSGVTPGLSAALTLGSPAGREAKAAGERILRSADRWRQSLAAVSDVLPAERPTGAGEPLDTTPVARVGAWAAGLHARLAELSGLAAQALTHCRRPAVADLGGLLSDLEAKDALDDIARRVEAESERLRGLFGRRYSGVETTWAELLAAIEWAGGLRALFGGRAMSTRLVSVAAEGPAPPERVRRVRALSDALDAAASALERLEDKFDPPGSAAGGAALRAQPFEAVRPALSALAERLDELADWVEYRHVEDGCARAGLSDWLDKVRDWRVEAELLPDLLRKAAYHAWVAAVTESDTRLEGFRSSEHEEVVREFCAADQRLVRLAPQAIVQRCDVRRPRGDFFQSADSEVAVLRKQASMQRRHLPIRQLFERMPNLLLKLKPCMLMSPLSVSQFLQSERLRFDLVIFDEASQIFTEDAVGAIYRGAQLVVAGDSKQLPPTDFFRGMDADAEVDADADDPGGPPQDSSADYASVLDECQTVRGIAVQPLRWHYRSRHESLIAFSNREYYDGKLITFPSARADHPELGVELAHLPDGVYDRGGRRHNLREAEEVARRVFAHFDAHQDKSLGVVAFSQAQMIAIEEEVERWRALRPEYDAFFREDRLEGFFVKNLENVQGDERDVIIFSVGYGRDAQGRMTMGFGPLNRAGGERRLNVAVTRAREKVVLVSSIKSADIRLTPASPAGVAGLQRYLEYAERGGPAPGASDAGPARTAPGIETDIGAELRRLGYEYVRGVGASEYRVDLGVVDPADPGRFLLGVEGDGATYREANTARDRDRLRPQVLRQLEWRLHRVWAADWALRRETEVRRLSDALSAARADRGVSPGAGAPGPGGAGDDAETAADDPAEHAPITRTEAPPAIGAQSLPGLTTYTVCRLPPSPSSYREFHDPANQQEQSRLVMRVVEVEGPVHVELVTQRLLEAWGKASAGARIKAAVQQAIAANVGRGTLVRDGDFLWPYPVAARRHVVRSPRPGDPATVREIRHVPPEEIHNAMLLVVSQAVGIGEESLMAETARIFGFTRVGAQIKERLSHELKVLRRRSAVEVSGGVVSIAAGGR